jgi:RNA polymerase sigma factor (TIGR02999 family)
MGELTELLRQARDGDAVAGRQLYERVYADLHGIARHQLRGPRDPASPQTTSLVHEAYLRLARPDGGEFQDRAHFFAVASRAMRQILIDHARRRQADKRGGGEAALDLSAVQIAASDRSDELLALDEALQRLEALDARLAQVVEWRFYGGLTEAEIGEALGLSERTIKRDWRRARAFLQREIAGRDPDEADAATVP